MRDNSSSLTSKRHKSTRLDNRLSKKSKETLQTAVRFESDRKMDKEDYFSFDGKSSNSKYVVSSNVGSYEQPRITAFVQDPAKIDFRKIPAGHASLGEKSGGRISENLP